MTGIKHNKRNALSNLSRTKKAIITLLLLVIIIALELSIIQDNRSTNGSIQLESSLTSINQIAQSYIENDTYYSRYGGYDLRPISMNQTCSQCFIATYSFSIGTPLLVNRIKGFDAIITIENDTVTGARYIRVS